MRTPRVHNLRGTSGREVPNQFIITTDDREVFQSYRTIIAVKDYDGTGTITLDASALDYSVTTSRYLYAVLREWTGRDWTRKDVLRAIESGRFATTHFAGQ